jgi:hypothetical protein
MQENFLLGSPFKFIYFLGVGWGNSGTYMFLINIPFKGYQGRSNRTSMTQHAFKKIEYLREFEFVFKKALAP